MSDVEIDSSIVVNGEGMDIKEGWMEDNNFHIITFDDRHIVFRDVFSKSYSGLGGITETISVEVSSNGDE